MPITRTGGRSSKRSPSSKPKKARSADVSSSTLLDAPVASAPTPTVEKDDWQKPMRGIGRVGKPVISESLQGAIRRGGALAAPKPEVYARALKEAAKRD